jgi:hypothetical protein
MPQTSSPAKQPSWSTATPAVAVAENRALSCGRCGRGTRPFALCIIAALTLALLGAAEWRDDNTRPAVRFAPVDVYLDSGQQRLAAYQVQITATRGDAKIVGIEGGDGAAFKEPPFYDPAALMGGRVILAAYSLADKLPAGKTRVARLHVQVTGNERPEYAVKLVVAGNRQGQSIQAGLSIAAGDSKQ